MRNALQTTVLLSLTASPAFADADALPRSLTPEEAAFVAVNPIIAPADRGVGPTGDVRCIAEYEPMDGIMMAYEGNSGWKRILNEMAGQITTAGGANVYVMCDTAGEANSARQSMVLEGADDSRVFTYVVPTDSIWMRDYGPRYIYESGIRAIIDHTYNRPRPRDNQIPNFWAGVRAEAGYDIPLVHGGGNYHLSAATDSYSTRLIANENPGLTEADIIQLWRDYQNLETTITDPFPSSVDATQHIDMWMQIISDDAAVIADWPEAQGSVQDQVCEQTTLMLESRGYAVHRVPNIGNPFQTHYTFTNVVMCNDIVLLPSYDGIPAAYSQQVLATWQAALPGKTIVQIDCDAIVTAAGVMHCIVMHVPANSAGESPVAWITSQNDGGSYEPGEQVLISWRSDDDKKDIASVDLLFSADGGQTFEPIAENLGDTGFTVWDIPDTATTQGVVRVTLQDGDGNTGSDDTDAPFSIAGSDPSCNIADVAQPFGVLDLADLQAFISAFNAGDPLADVAQPFGVLDLADIQAFVGEFLAGCP